MNKIFSKLKKIGGGVAFILVLTLFFGVFIILNNDKTSSYALNEGNEVLTQAEGEISDIEVEVDYTKTNSYGAQGIYTSMGVQDLIDGKYLNVKVNYANGESAVISSGYELSMSSEFFSPGNVNEVMLKYNDVTTTFLINATLVQIQTLNIDTAILDETNIYENFLVNNLNDYIVVTGVNNDGSPFNNSEQIQYDETGVNGYTLQGPSSGALTAEENIITVSYQNATGRFLVNAIAREIVSISAVFNQGDTIIYSTDYTITLTNYLTVTAQYNDGSSEEVNRRNYAITGDLFTSAEALDTPTVTRICTVELVGNEEINTTFKVEVTPDIPISVTATQGYHPYYYAQDTFNPSGSTITVVFQHAGAITVTNHYYVIYQEDDNRLHVSDEYVQIGYRENGVTATPSGNLPVFVEQLEVVKVSMPNHDFTYIESENEEEQTHSITIYYYNNQRMRLEVAKDSAEGMTIDEDTGTLSAINAGIYKVNIILDDDYIWVGGSSDPITLEWEIKPSSFSSSVGISSWDYGEQAISPYVTNNPGEVSNSSIIYYYYGTSYDGTFNHTRQDQNTIVPTVAGEYRVYAYIPAGGNYSAATTSDTLFYIRVADNQITASNYSWQYDELNANKLNPEFSTKFDLITSYTIAYYQDEIQLGLNSYSSDGTYQGTSEYYPINADTYTVRITVEGTDNYNTATRDITLNITRKPIDVNPSLDTSNLVFSGSANQANTQSKALSNYDETKMTFTFTSSDGQNYSEQQTNGAYFVIEESTVTFYSTNVISNGNYTVRLTINSNYSWHDGSYSDLVFSWQITQASNQVQITNKDEFSIGWTYSEQGLDINPEFTALFYQTNEPTISYYVANGEELGELLENAPVNAGTYFVVVSVNETLNYSGESDRCKFTISKKEIAIPNLDHNLDVYNNSEKSNSISNYDSVSMSIDDDNTTVTYAISGNTINLTEMSAGRYKITFKLNSSNYKWSDGSEGNKECVWTIEKASLEKPQLTTNTDYTGSLQSIDLSNYGVTSKMLVNVSTEMQEIGLSNLNQTLSATDAHSYNISISILDPDNHKWLGDSDETISETLTFVWVINKIELQVDWTQTSFVYTGYNIEPTYSISGWKGSDSNSANGNYTINISGGQINVGESYLAKLSLTKKDGGNVNYTLSSDQTTFDIDKASLYVTFTDTSLEYNGEKQAPKYQVTDFLVPNEVNIYSFVFTTFGTNVGQYSTTLTLTSNNEKMNYELYLTGNLEPTTDFNITKATLNIDWGELEFQFDNSEKLPTPIISGWFNNDEQFYDIEVTSSEETINAGTYTASISLSLKEEGVVNYELEETSTSFEILKAKIDVSLIVSEPENIDGNTNLTDRRIPFTTNPIELVVKESDMGLYNFASNKYLNSEFSPVNLNDIVSVATYYIVLELTDPKNYEWYNYNNNDIILNEDNQTIRLWYQITLAQFDMQLSIPELDDNNEIIYGNAYSFKIDNNPNQAPYSVDYYSVDGMSEVKLDSQPTNAGDYILKVTIEASGDYDTMTEEIRFTITKRVLTVTITVSDGVYGEWKAAYIQDNDIMNLAGSNYLQVNGDDFTFQYLGLNTTDYNDSIPPKNVGEYSVKALLEDDNYTIETTKVEFEITKASLDISINPVEIDYGDEDPTLFYSGSSHITYDEEQLKNGDKIDNLGISFIYESTYEQGDPVGTYYIYLSYGQNEIQSIPLQNYNLSITRGTLTVDKLLITATVDIDNQNFEYDGNNIYNLGSRVGATATANGVYNNEPIEFTYNYVGINGTQYESLTAPINAGEYQVVVTIKSNTDAYKNYSLASTIAKFTITRASLTININDASIIYGDEDPTKDYNNSSFITFNDEELKGNDRIDSIGLTFVFSSNYNAGDNALGEYYIYLPTYGESVYVEANIQNYALKINAGSLTVNKKAISATIDVDQQSFEFDGDNIYLGDISGAIASPSWSFNDEQIEFIYTYSGVLDTTYESTTLAPINVGNYRVVVTLQPDSTSENNYIFDSISALFSITKKKVDVIWQTSHETFIYNGLDQSLNNGIVAKYVPANADVDNDGILSIAITEGESKFINAGTYKFTASLISDIELRNYELVKNVTVEITINQATISSIDWNYTAEDYFIYNGNNQSIDKVFATFEGVESTTHNLDLNSIKQNEVDVQFINAGNYQIYVKFKSTDSQNYKFANDLEIYHTYTIKNADITLNGEVVGYSGVYDANEHNVAASLPELNFITSAGTPNWKFRIKTVENSNEFVSSLTVKNVDEYTIEYLIELDNHNNCTGEFNVSITKKLLTLTATTTIQFGNNITQNIEDYIITASNENDFAGNENVNVLSGTPTFSTDNYNAGESGVGRYNLSIKGFSSNNYTIDYNIGEIIVVPREIVISITSISRTYGEGLTDEFPVSNSSIISGALDGVNPADIYSLAVYKDNDQIVLVADLDVGDYDVKPIGVNENYNITQVANGTGAYRITQKPISIQITNSTHQYDGQRHGVTATISTPDVDLEIIKLYSSSTYGGEQGTDVEPWEVGTYNVIVQIVDSDASNYQVNYETSAELNITARPISIVITDQSADYSGSEPTVAKTMGDASDNKNWYINSTLGLCENVNGEMDDLKVVLSIPSGSVNAGTYTISGTHDNENYDVIAWTTGEFTINQLDLEISIKDQEITYGYAPNSFELSYDGFINGEDENTEGMFVGGVPTASTNYQIGNPVGNYVSTFLNKDITSKNYKITFVDGKIEVVERKITVKILNQTAPYSGTKPIVSSKMDEGWTVTSEETIYLNDNLNIELTIEDTEFYNVGQYDLNYSYDNDNYIINFEENSNINAFTISKVELKIKAKDVSVQYGNSPENTYSIVGFVNDSESSSLIDGLDLLTFNNVDYNTTLGVGATGNITITGIENLKATNYSFASENGKWTVIKRNINIEMDSANFYLNQVNVYGEFDVETLINPAKAKVVVGGLVESDSAGDNGDVDVLFNYKYYGTSNDETWNYPLDGEGSSVNPTRAGTYSVVVTIVSDNYRINAENERVTFTYIILKHRVTTPSWQTSSFDATGKEHTNILYYNVRYSNVYTSSHPITNDNNGTVTMTASDSGEYSVTLELIDYNNYVWSSATGSIDGDNPRITISYTISRNNDNEFTSEITILVDDKVVSTVNKDGKVWFNHTWVYGDNLNTPSITAQYGTVQYDYYYAETLETVGGKPVNAGNYYVVASVAGTADWNGISYEPIYFTILPKSLPIPTIENATYQDGTSIKMIVKNYQSSYMQTLGNNVELIFEENNLYLQASYVRLGGYYVNISLLDTNNYKWENDSINAIRLEWNILPKSIEKPNLNEQTYEYDGTVKEYVLSNENLDKYYSIISNGTAINAGDYVVVVALINKTNYCWNDLTTENVSQTWKITQATDNVVSVTNSDLIQAGWTYGEEFIEPIVSDVYDGTININYYEVNESGNVLLEEKPTTVGNYCVVVSSSSANNNFNTDSLTINFTIKKASLTITLHNATITYGDKMPNVEYSVHGLIENDSINNEQLVIDCDYNLNDIENRDAGQYTISVSGLDMKNYNVVYENASLTVLRKDITITLSNQTSVYTGKEPIVNQFAYSLGQDLCFDSDDLNIVISKSRGVNAGKYELIATVSNDNYNGNVSNAVYTIERAKISASEIVFEDKIFVSDGSVHSLEISGNLPSGVTVEYENNYAILPGIYIVKARLIYDELNYDYVGAQEFNATMTINASELTIAGDYKQDKLIIFSQNGFNPNYILTISDITEYQFDEGQLENYDEPKFAIGYNIDLLNGDINVDLTEKVSISLLLPENLMEANFVLLQNNNGANRELDYDILGNYIVFETDNLGDILLVRTNSTSSEETNLIWLVITLAVVLVLILIWFIFTIIKARKIKNNNVNMDDSNNESNTQNNQKSTSTKLNSFIFSPLLLALIPKSQLISIIILSVVCAVLLIATIIIHIKNTKAKKANQIENLLSNDVNSNENNVEEVVNIENEDEENEERLSGYNFNFKNKKFRSFRTKLRQSDQEIKNRYKDFINFSKTLPEVKNIISKKQVRVYKGRKTLAIIYFKGKTLCVAFSLDPQKYEKTKYKGVDQSSIKKFQNTPLLIKLTSDRRLEVAKYLLKQSV